jgi:hypothetical protein
MHRFLKSELMRLGGASALPVSFSHLLIFSNVLLYSLVEQIRTRDEGNKSYAFEDNHSFLKESLFWKRVFLEIRIFF